MADKKKEGSQAYSMLPAKPILVASAICLVIGVYQAWPGNPIAKAVEAVGEIKFSTSPTVTPVRPSLPSEAAKQQIIRVELDPEQWSEWVHIPPHSTFEIDRPGTWIEFEFLLDKSRKRLEGDAWQSLGKIPDRTFRLRGTKGPVEILIEPKQ